MREKFQNFGTSGVIHFYLYLWFTHNTLYENIQISNRKLNMEGISEIRNKGIIEVVYGGKGKYIIGKKNQVPWNNTV